MSPEPTKKQWERIACEEHKANRTYFSAHQLRRSNKWPLNYPQIYLFLI